MVNGAKEKSLVRGDKVEVTHLQFAFETVFFFFWVLSNEQNMINLMSVLNIFCLIFQLKGKYGEKLVIGY